MSEKALLRACVLHRRSVDLRAAGDPKKALRAALSALRIFEENDGPNHPDVANALLAVASAKHDLARYGDALEHARRALGILERAGGRSRDLRRLRVQSLAAVGSALIATGLYEAARAPLKRAVRLAQRLSEADRLNALNLLAITGKYTARYDEAASLYRGALALVEGRPGSELSVASILHNIAGLDHSRGRFRRAETVQRRGLALRERFLGKHHPHVAADVAALAAILQGSGQYDEARALYRRALGIFTRKLGREHFEVGFNLGNLASLCSETGRFAEATKLYARAIAIKRRTLGPHHPDLALTLANFGALRRVQGRYDEARALYEEALTILRATVGAEHPETRRCARVLASLAKPTGGARRARSASRRDVTG